MAGGEYAPNAGGEHLHGGDRLVRALGILQAEQVFGTPEAREAFLQDLDTSRMVRLLDWANGVVRGEPPLRPSLDDPSQGSVIVNFAGERPTIVCVPPLPEDRPGLFGQLLEGTKTAQTQEDQGLLLGLGINIVHLRDGTGRMGRLADSLLLRGFDNTPKDQLYYIALLENTEGRLLLDPQPRPLLNSRYADYSADQLWQSAGQDGVPPAYLLAPEIDFLIDEQSLGDPKKLATLLCKEEYFGPANALAITKETGRDIADYLRITNDGKQVIDAISLINSLTAEDTGAVRRAHISIKQGFLTAIIQCLAEGDESIFGPVDVLRRRYAPFDRALPSLPGSVAAESLNLPPGELPKRQPGRHFPSDPTIEALRRVMETLQNNTETSSE